MPIPAIAYILFVSVAAALMTIYDKVAEKRGSMRVPEAALMLMGVVGGAAAELLTMLFIRHKTRHALFMIGLPLLILGHTALIRYLWFQG